MRTVPGLAVRYGLSVDAMLDDVNAETIEQWRTLYDLEPWAEERADIAAGIGVMHTVAAAGVKPRQPVDYMPYLQRDEPKPQSVEEQKAVVNAICANVRNDPRSSGVHEE